MNPHWLPLLACVGALAMGAALATAFWWWAAPRVLLMRWSAPLRDALDAGFSDQGLQYRLRAQADKLWTRRQHALLRESLEQIHARHEACLVAEMRSLMRSAGPAAGRRADVAAPAIPPAPAASAPTPERVDRPQTDGQRNVPADQLTDEQVDALAPELPHAVAAGRRRAQTGMPPPAFESI